MRERRTARAVMLDPDDRVLLFEFLMAGDDMSGLAPRFWATPGGEIEPGEAVLDGLRREVLEETGISDITVGPQVWSGRNVIRLRGETVATHERFFIVRCASPVLGVRRLTDVERQMMRAWRWWTVPDLCETPEPVFPPRLGHLVRSYLDSGYTGCVEIAL